MKAFENLTVGQYQELYKINTSEMEEEDKIIQSVCVLTGKTEREVDDMFLSEFNRLSSSLADLFNLTDIKVKAPKYIRVGTRIFGINYDVRKLRSAQYIELIHFFKADDRGMWISNMDKIIASIVYPVKKFGPFVLRGKNDSSKHEINAFILQEAKFLDVYGICVFFSTLYKNSIRAIVASLEPELLKKMSRSQLSQLQTILATDMDGFTTPSRLRTLKT